MRKILLLLLPFFLWTCGGGSTEPKEPPSSITINSISLERDSISINWNRDISNNFDKYYLLGSLTQDFSNPTLITSSSEQSTTSHTLSIKDQLSAFSGGRHPRYYAIENWNTEGISTLGPIKSDDSLFNVNLIFGSDVTGGGTGEFLGAMKTYNGLTAFSNEWIFKLENIQDSYKIIHQSRIVDMAYNQNIQTNYGFHLELSNGNILVSTYESNSLDSYIEVQPFEQDTSTWVKQISNGWKVLGTLTFGSIFHFIESADSYLYGVNGDSMIKLDLDGNEIWNKDIASYQNDHMINITNDENFLYVLGAKENSAQNRVEVSFSKFTYDGDEILTKQFSDTNYLNQPHKIYLNNDGTLSIIYNDFSNVRILVVDKEGNKLSDNAISSEINLTSINRIDGTDSFVGGYSSYYNGFITVNIQIFDKNGIVNTFSHQYGDGYNISIRSVISDGDEFLIAGGYENYNINNNMKLHYLFRLNANGEISRTY